MEDDSKTQGFVKWGLGVLGLGALVAAITIPRLGIWIALGIVLLALLFFGGYYLWRRQRARRQREHFSSTIEAQTEAAPRSISDPRKRADLDKVRGKFQGGLQEFKSRGKDLYALPWYVIVGESGSGKSEAIRHSEIDFPPGLNKEHQGTGGTVNMDWWFSNRGVILDTAGSMLFPEAGAGDSQEWPEFLRLLKKARPHCPINGLFLVLSVESLIKDSADKIAQKASRLAQQLDVIQRTLDVRFPVYLLVTKCDLLTGFREFFDSIDDPLLQHQIFGWSNPDPLDTPFRPDLVDQHLGNVADRVSRRRLALLRESSAAGRLGDTQQFFAASYQLGRGPAGARRLDEVDSMFALPESIMRLAPRLRRYLETVFVAGEWSAKPVFLRGIYFTSSMREGKALDEAISFATGLSLDQLPEDRNWDKNRAFFLRDLFHEKVFRESGLVTRATNTLKLLRQRQLAIFGTAGAAILLLLVFALLARNTLRKSIDLEARYWRVGAASNNWSEAVWAPSVVRSGQGSDRFRFSYEGTNLVEGTEKLSLVEYHKRLSRIVEKPLQGGIIFKPLIWAGFGNVGNRRVAQRVLFESSILRPLVWRTRLKVTETNALPLDAMGLARQREALLALMQVEADGLLGGAGGGFLPDAPRAEKFLKAFVSYLTEQDWKPDPDLVEVFARTYSKDSLAKSDGKWPPSSLLGGNTLATNTAIKVGLENFNLASRNAQTNIDQQSQLLDGLTDNLAEFSQEEQKWLANSTDSCQVLANTLAPIQTRVAASRLKLEAVTNFPAGPLTNLASRYLALQIAASNASVSSLSGPVAGIVSRLPESAKLSGLFKEISKFLDELALQAAGTVRASYEKRREKIASLDTNCLVVVAPRGIPAYESRWMIYTGACALASAPVTADERAIGDGWRLFEGLKGMASQSRSNIAAYKGPLAEPAATACIRIAGEAEEKLKGKFIDGYVNLVTKKLTSAAAQSPWTTNALADTRGLFGSVLHDLDTRDKLETAEKQKLEGVLAVLTNSIRDSLVAINRDIRTQIGFPVILDGQKIMDKPTVLGLSRLMDTMDNELKAPVWTNFLSSKEAMDSLRTTTRSYRSVITALVPGGGADNSAAKVRFSLIPHEAKEGSDFEFTKVYRWARLKIGARETEEKEITSQKDPIALGEGTVDLALKFSFRDVKDQTVFKETKPWGFVQLINDKDTVRIDDGKTWRVRFKPPDSVGESRGVVIEVQLDQPLPKLEDWPRQ